jgi:hypothetical protein
VRKSQDPRAKGASTNIHNDHKWSGRGPNVDVELFNCNRVYRCIVLRRLMPDIQRDLRFMPTRVLLQLLWAAGGEERNAAQEEVRWRLFGDRGAAA